MRSLASSASLVAGCLGLLVATAPRPADACGGTFCDAGQGPQSMPVDQTGETIVFVVDESSVEAHIQVDYDPTTDAERFAWLIPVFGEPELGVGSQQLFINLQNSTVPSFGFTNSIEQCDGDWDEWGDDGWYDGCGGTSGAYGDSAAGGDGGQAGDDGGTTGGGAEVVQQEAVGAFDVTVLQAQTSAELMTWLGDNDFFQDPAAEPILQEYIDEGAMFAAIRLAHRSEVGEIHPITLRYEGGEPCVPIRLTRIAAQDDMDIRVFFLGPQRVWPSNYRHVELNEAKLDWIALGEDYRELVTMAVDEPLAGGHAFVTEYADDTALVPRDGLVDERWDHNAFVDMAAQDAPGELTSQGLLDCSGAQCDGHPLVLGLLADYLPVPPGISNAEYYSCISCYEDMADLSQWDGTAFALDLKGRVIRPGYRAQQILDENPFLTRMYTTISPHEMTVDPMFHLDDGTAERVNLTTAFATRNFPCAGWRNMELPRSGRTVRLDGSNTWPDIASEAMPWSERITEHLPGVAPVVLVDNSELIDQLIEAWNAGTSPIAASCLDGDHIPLPGGCGCRTDRGNAPASWMMLLLAGLGLRRLGRKRRRT